MDSPQSHDHDKPSPPEPGTPTPTVSQQIAVASIHNHYCKDILEVAHNLQGVCNVQDTANEILENRLQTMIEIRENHQMDEVLDEALRYNEKLLNLRKEMTLLSRKSKDLARRADHIRSVRQRDQAKKAEEEKKRQQLERDLEPRYSAGLRP